MRKYWLDTMLKIADPVLLNLAEGRLHKTLPTDFHSDRKAFACLEAFARTACGMAPWLEAELPEGREKQLQKKYRQLMLRCIENATDPQSPDYMNWCHGGGQPLVDAAFLAHAVVRAPEVMFHSLEVKTKNNFIACLKKTRAITPVRSNWLFFSAMVETALYIMGSDYDLKAVDTALDTFKGWYVGDGTYSDGDFFHWDYYNSFVIHPMQVDILRTLSEVRDDYKAVLPEALKKASRYSAVLERLISPDGSYAVFGRSTAYRFGAFQLLSQAALQGFLPEEISYGQARCCLSSVIKRVCESENLFDEKGWLTPGVYGRQPHMAESYINIGSLYLCQTVFLPLALDENHKFWTAPAEACSWGKIWSGEMTKRDFAID